MRISSRSSTFCTTNVTTGHADAATSTYPSCASNPQPVIYDPYYCDGRAAKLLRQVGFGTVVHEKRDFYQDIRDKTVPPHDVLITNPPYSDQHKQQCLQYCFEQLKTHDKPFFVLLPAYVAARQYYKTLLDQYQAESVVYSIPKVNYEYSHPEGTGHETSPFQSLWFCGIGREAFRTIRHDWTELQAANNKAIPTLALSLFDLEDAGIISTAKRPNPKQRRKKRKQAVAEANSETEAAAASTSRVDVTDHHRTTEHTPPMTKAKWRDETGKRTRKRF